MDMLSYSKEREPAIEATDLNAGRPGGARAGRRPRPRSWRPAGDAGWTTNLPVGAGRPGGHSPGAAEHRQQRPGRRRGPEERRSVGACRRCRTPTSELGADRGARQRRRHPAGEAGRHLQAVRQHQGGHGAPAWAWRSAARSSASTAATSWSQSELGKGSKFILRLPIKSPLSVDGSGQTREIRAMKLPRDES